MQIPNEILYAKDELEDAEFKARRLKDIFQTKVNLFAIKLAKDMGHEWGQEASDTFFNIRIKIDQVFGQLVKNHANVKSGVGPFWRMVVIAKGPRLTKHGVIDKRAGDTEIVLQGRAIQQKSEGV